MPFEPGPHDSKLWIPEDASARVEKDQAATVVVDNQTDLLDEELMTYLVDNTAMFGFGQETRYLSYPAEGTAMARSKWRPPRNVIEEIAFSRDMMERDDDCSSTMDAIIAAAYGAGAKNQHEDEQIEHTFEEMSEETTGLVGVLKDMHRELMISSQITTVNIFTPATYDIRPENVSRVISRSIAAPLIGVLPAERIRILGNDFFGRGQLAYRAEGALVEWLRLYWSDATSPAKKREMAKADPFAAALFIGKADIDWYEQDLLATGMDLYLLNPEMVDRSTFPKGSWRYPRPLLTRNFPLLEAKRLLNVMDHALLQGGINYVVVAKKGDDKKPATNNELLNLQGLMQRAARTGIMVGDHRIDFDIVQPKLDEMLNPAKRQMIGRKLSQGLLRVPEFGSDDTGAAVQTFTEVAQSVITSDRHLVVGHVHRYIWRKVMKRNQRVFNRTDRPTIWLPKVILQGMDFWTQYLLKLYDRGDLPRKYMVEFGGYDYDAVKAQKQREVEGGHDAIFAPPAVPYTAPNQTNNPNQDPSNPYRFGDPNAPPSRGPQDNGTGRPRGAPTTQPGAPADRQRPSRVIRRTPGETVRADWSEDEQTVVRIGEVTERILGEYPDATLGRTTPAERAALEQGHTTNVANVIAVPVNTGYEIEGIQAVRLGDGLSMLVGKRVPDGAVLAAAVCFREPNWTIHQAEDTCLRWGFEIALIQADGAGESLPDDGDDILTCPSCGETTAVPADACSNCGFAGPPFTFDEKTQRQIQQQVPVALTINVNGERVTVEPTKPEEGDDA